MPSCGATVAAERWLLEIFDRFMLNYYDIYRIKKVASSPTPRPRPPLLHERKFQAMGVAAFGR